MACLVNVDSANAARTIARGTATTRKTVTATNQTVKTENTDKNTENSKSTTEITEQKPINVSNKESQFQATVSAVIDSASNDNSFAQEIRKQRAALSASMNQERATNEQKQALQSGSNSCDRDLRQCMFEKCGNGFTDCALDGDTVFGDKLEACKRNTKCSGEEFSLFATEIKADRDMNVRLTSYDNVVNCGNQYNACIVNECGTTYSKCLGKTNADAAIKKCENIAKECSQADSGLAARFSNVIGKLRETAEINIKSDEERLYALRDSMKSSCEKMGAMFDERTFDCVYTINFFAGNNQSAPIASRKRYAGDAFVCTQEWFGVNATTFKENALRETRSQTAASSAMLGSGVGTAVGLVTSGAINRAIDTQKAKKDLKQECEDQGGTLKDGECVFETDEPETNDKTKEEKTPAAKDKCHTGNDGNGGTWKAGACYCGGTIMAKNKTCKNNHIVGATCILKVKNFLSAKYDDNGECKLEKCVVGYEPPGGGGPKIKNKT